MAFPIPRSSVTRARAETVENLLGAVDGLVQELRPGSPGATLDSSLERDLGLDSLARMELLLRLEGEFGVGLSEQAMAAAETPRDLLRLLVQERPRKPGELVAQTPLEITEAGPAEAAPHRARTLVEVLDWHADAHPERVHIHLYGEGDAGVTEITYGALLAGAETVAAGLRQRHLEPGRAVAIMLPTGVDYFFSFYGVLLAGGVPVPLYPPVRPSQIEDHLRRQARILVNCQASHLITVPEAKAVARILQSQVEGLLAVVTVADLQGAGRLGFRPRLQEEDLAFLQYTSGSTGQPKGVVLTHRNLLTNLRCMVRAADVDSNDVFISWLPLYHDMGLIGAGMGSLYFAFPLVLMSPLAFLGRPQRWLWAIHRHRGTLTAGPNFAYELCLNKVPDGEIEGLDLSSMRLMLNGAEPVSPDTLTRFTRRFSAYGLRPEALFPVYGLAENSLGLSFPPPGREPRIDRVSREAFTRSGRADLAREEDEADCLRFVSCGFPIPQHQIRVVDETGNEVEERQEGRVQFRGPSSTSGYFRNPEATRPLFDGDWVNSGDRGYVAQGEIYLTGRSKDIIIRAGRNLSPYELEEAVGNLPGVRKGCVVVFGARAAGVSGDLPRARKDGDSESGNPTAASAPTGTERLVILAETRESDPDRRRELEGRVLATATDILGTPPDDVVLAPPGTVLKTSSGKLRRAASRELYEAGKIGAGPRQVWRQFLRLGLWSFLPLMRRWARVVSHYVYSVYTWGLLLLALPPVWFLVVLTPGVNRRQRLIRGSARLLCRLAGIPLLTEGLEHLPRGEASVLAANHSSYLDAGVLLATLPPGLVYVAKSELGKSFFTRAPLRALGVELVERFDAQRGAEDAGRLQEQVASGRSLLFFPEGTFTRMPGLLPFRMGAFTVAAGAGVPVVPVVVRGTRSLLRADQWLLRRGPVSVSVYAPLRPRGSDWSAAVALRDAVRSELLKRTGEPDLTPSVPGVRPQ